MDDLKDLLSSGVWSLSFENELLQKQLGDSIESCEAKIVGGSIILFSPILKPPFEIEFLSLESITNGFIDPFTKNEVTIEPSGITLKSDKYGIIRMVEYSEK